MYWKNLLSACMGLWFVVSPWVFGFEAHTNALYTCALLGSLQFVGSLLALGKTGKKVWQNWFCFIIGAVFIVVPNVYHLDIMAFFSFVVLGFMTILVNYANLYADQQ
ncbi:SPW repeat protein [Paenibacillus alginolyticus]|uniref:SPW repeat protein n=1 Tax=Paenibacillus alginolyticus TaxID=59839 RepID=A0ABT4G9B9_9BACL|nr:MULTISPECIES: SPW repeat protein [Paenibacillus]MCY9665159.1 SPW repeat protein [Paenibacillus alginolyticus]MCY9692777.1 SPW repeat protein [Paenibacillus alginolyticus]MEC0146098.1 SPW repeat protein [Paenibacillus alginolyticus]NRF94667.1 SPW repeat protein [Paenibacillus frigoriresistens]